jgi:paraquat-inducible protein B
LQDLQTRVDAALGHVDDLTVDGRGQLDSRGADLHRVLAAAADTATRASTMLESLRGLTSDRGATRVNLDAALRDIASAAASLRGFASDVEHNPQLLLTGRRP